MAGILNSSEVENFRKDGYVVIRKFLTLEEIDALKNEYMRLVEKVDPITEKSIFASSSNGNSQTSYQGDDYFITSGDKIRYFFESKAFDEDGNLKYEKWHCINKIGHALHFLNPTFKKITFSNKVKDVVKSLNMSDPVIIHSMYISKPPFIGSEVVPHQDATYLYCEPHEKLIGLWIALEDTDTENGCLWFIPESHKDPVSRRMIRVVENDQVKLQYVGRNPEYDRKLFIPVPVKKGDLIVIHGKVVHKSEDNLSKRPRPIYTFHVMDKNEAYFSESNWIQESDAFKFPSLFSI
ncbi:Phytanoyl-CoA dioxygenase domain-containing protein 1 [Chamberlinius hualienensis]